MSDDPASRPEASEELRPIWRVQLLAAVLAAGPEGITGNGLKYGVRLVPPWVQRAALRQLVADGLVTEATIPDQSRPARSTKHYTAADGVTLSADI